MLTERTTTLFVSIFYFQKCQTRDYTIPGRLCKGDFRGSWLVARRGRPVKAARLWEFRGSWPAASSKLLIWPCQKGRFRLYYTKKVVFNILLEIKERYL